MVSYECRDDERLVAITIEGEFNITEIHEVLARHGAERNWELGTLWDLRKMSGTPTTSDLWSLSQSLVHDPTTAPPRRGPAAIVTTNPAMYDTACLYVAMSRPELEVDAFRHMDEARSWLANRLAASTAG